MSLLHVKILGQCLVHDRQLNMFQATILILSLQVLDKMRMPGSSPRQKHWTSLVIQCLRLRLPNQWVWVLSLVGEMRSHMPHSTNTETQNRRNIIKKILKSLKKQVIHIKKKKKDSNTTVKWSLLAWNAAWTAELPMWAGINNRRGKPKISYCLALHTHWAF